MKSFNYLLLLILIIILVNEPPNVSSGQEIYFVKDIKVDTDFNPLKTKDSLCNLISKLHISSKNILHKSKSKSEFLKFQQITIGKQNNILDTLNKNNYVLSR